MIFDCGANIGIATLYFKWLYPNSEIHVFEADPETFKILKKNIEINKLTNVYAYNVALYDKKGKVKFYIDKKNPGWLTMSTDKNRLPGKDAIEVSADKLSNYIKGNIDFLKMDVEGAEIHIIKELVKSKKLDNVLEIVLEYHHNIKEIDRFTNFLKQFDKNYTVQFDSSLSNNIYQDILMHVDKK